jgi:hypothetical protein
MSDPRPVSGLERLWLAAGRLAPPFALHFVVELSEALPKSDVERAVLALHMAWPRLHVRLEGQLRGARWRPDPAPPALHHHPRLPWAEGPLPDALLDALNAGAGPDPERGPTLWWTLCDGPRPLLVLSGLHAILDGRTGYAALAALFASLRGEAPPVPGPPLHEGQRAAALGARPIPPPPADQAAPFSPDGQPEAQGSAVVRRRVEVAPRRPLALLLAAIAEGRPGLPLRVDLPVDLRAPELGLRLGNLTGLLRLTLPTGGPQDPIARAELIQNTIAQAISAGAHLGGTLEAQRLCGLPLWLLAGVGRRRARAERRAERVSVSMTLSNLGRIDLAPLFTGSVRAISCATLPPPSPGLPVLCTMTGALDAAGACALELVAAAPAAWISPEALDRLISGWAALLGGGAPVGVPASGDVRAAPLPTVP